MLRQVLVAVAAVAISAGAAAAQTKVEQTPIKQIPASDARAMFDNYCAVCHGKTGVGNGPAASSLVKAPADLTKIAARNGGTFPEVKVKRWLRTDLVTCRCGEISSGRSTGTLPRSAFRPCPTS
jgi:hypothetical protein